MSPPSSLLGVVAAGAVAPITLAVGIGLGTASGSENTQVPGTDPSCLGTTGAGMDAGQGKINEAQARNAQTIYQVATAAKLPARAAVIAIATAMQKPRLVNHTTTDHDSLGLFQQRPSQGWGTPAQVTDPAHAAKRFYARLVEVPRWQNIPLTRAAQAVQRSAYPDAYAR
ncbi:hypothetical protein SAMN04489712_105523 [Thermomonospora echinospora]|uniref:Transglycosylase SLT domain-containing protein n=1 Tax=Thermomonospora echinospora TaxID=1992 RepID=A0A1H6AKK6_9ACTN|nr:hypothetical protein [Thermomonospora echinospora]SEG49259.1 hypothetical protein SAMN04489712_105523 [Thermomonospora echinospora]